MAWASESIVTIDTDDSDSDGDTTNLEALPHVEGEFTGDSFHIQSGNIDTIKTEYADEIVTDVDALDHLVPNYFLNLTGYVTQASSSFTIISDEEEVTIDSEFMLYLPNIVDQSIAEGIFTGGPLYVQNLDTEGNPTGTIYEVDMSSYTPINGGNWFILPCVINGIDGEVQFTKKSGIDEITGAEFIPTDPYLDTDEDWLSDYEEVMFIGTDPLKPDSDGDGMMDGLEVIYYGTDPNEKTPDADGDMLPDVIETEYGTNPNKIDSDGDGLNDFDEFFVYYTDPTMADTDEDGLSDYDEINKYETDPWEIDTDDDGLTDGAEVNKYKTDPNDPDSDNDGVLDGVDVLNTAEGDIDEDDTDEEDTDKPDELAYTGNTTHFGGIVGATIAGLFILLKRRG